jgi:hypothetical protein
VCVSVLKFSLHVVLSCECIDYHVCVCVCVAICSFMLSSVPSEMAYDRSNNYVFTSLVHPLELQAGSMKESKSYPFDFTGVEKQHESYNGINVRLRYAVVWGHSTNIGVGCW